MPSGWGLEAGSGKKLCWQELKPCAVREGIGVPGKLLQEGSFQREPLQGGMYLSWLCWRELWQ